MTNPEFDRHDSTDVADDDWHPEQHVTGVALLTCYSMHPAFCGFILRIEYGIDPWSHEINGVQSFSVCPLNVHQMDITSRHFIGTRVAENKVLHCLY